MLVRCNKLMYQLFGFGFFFLCASVLAKETQVIYPTGAFPDDVEKVQDAIDDFASRSVDGRLVLKAENVNGDPTPFNFGTADDPLARGTVVIDSESVGSLEFVGEGPGHETQTMILGGRRSISMFRRGKIAVKNLRFEGPFDCAICVFATTGAEIKDNIILNTVGSGMRFSMADPITFGDNTLTFKQITGELIITDNLIDTAFADFSDGIFLFTTDARVVISDNSIFNTNTGVRVLRYKGQIQITGNHIAPISDFNGFFISGIGLVWGKGDKAKALLLDNEIEMTAPWDYGISAFVGDDRFAPAEESVIRNSAFVGNRITMSGNTAPEGDRSGIYLFTEGGRISKNLLAANEVTGSAKFGINLDGVDVGEFPAEAFRNFIVANDLNAFSALEADLLFGEVTRDNLFVGTNETVLDLGQNNRIICTEGCPSPNNLQHSIDHGGIALQGVAEALRTQ